jgi:hypothetical protein
MQGIVLFAVAAALLLPAAAAGVAPALPETTITAGPVPHANTTTAMFTFTSSNPKGRFACALDAGAFANCTTPYTIDVADGEHHFSVVAVVGDKADATPAVWAWTVDTVAPTPVKAHLMVGYGRLALRWGSMQAIGADSVIVYRSTDAKKPPAKEVYRGHGNAYVDTRFVNGAYHRYRAFSVDAAGNVGQPVDLVVGPDALLTLPKPGARLRAPPKLRWRSAPKATYYNLQLFLGDKKVLSTWPRGAHLTLGRSWTYNGRRFHLSRGLYTWYVWPGFGPLALGHYGRLLGKSSFSMR